MKILIAYDGSPSSDAAIDDLRRAGLSSAGEAVVISVADIWMPPANSLAYTPTNDYIEGIVARQREKCQKILDASQEMAEKGADQAKVALPGWNITGKANYGSPGHVIIDEATAFHADLIVMGSHGYSLPEKLFLGSVSQQVATEAHCSVRVARGKIDVDPSPVRIVIAFDGSSGAQKCVDEVSSRNWPEGTSVQLVSILKELSPTIVGTFVPSVLEAAEDINQSEREWIERAADSAISQLQNSGLDARHEMLSGNAKRNIVAQADAWDADVIFVGANAFGSRLERFFLGSTSSAVASRASCSVEIVRRDDRKDQ
jgi:nucleotide-binding universal stress UspA family protein